MDTIKQAILRVIIYARVSTDDQADKGYSLPTQLEACRKYAERLGFTVVAEFQEDYSGATPIAERPEGKKVVDMLRRREADAIVVYQVDRLSRDIVDLLARVQMWTRSGIEIHACDIGRIKNELDIVLVIKGWQGSDEREKILERTTRGRNAKAQAGKVVGMNRAPFGYRFIRDHNNKVIGFEIYEEEAGIVRLIFQWYVRGDVDGKPLPMLAIARRLQGMRIPTPGNGVYASRGARGIWSHSTIKTIISNETYAGVWHFGDRKGALRKRTSAEQQITVNVPEIIDRETYEAAQAQRKYNKAMAKRNAKRDYLLRGLIGCACGRHMTGAVTGSGTIRRYVCTGRHYIDADCRARTVQAETIEAQIWEELRGFFQDLDRLERKLRIAQQEELDQQEPKRDELEAVEANIKHAINDADEIAAVLPKARGRVKESLEVRMDEVNARYDALTKRRDVLVSELGARRLTDEAVGYILTYARRVGKGIEKADFGDRRRVLEGLGVGLSVRDRHYAAKCLLGEWTGEIRHNGKQSIESGMSLNTHINYTIRLPLINLAAIRAALHNTPNAWAVAA